MASNATAVEIVQGEDTFDFDEEEVIHVAESIDTFACDTKLQSGGFSRTYIGDAAWNWAITIRASYQSTMAGYNQGDTAGKLYRIRRAYKTVCDIYPYYFIFPLFHTYAYLVNPEEILDRLIHGRSEAFFDTVLKFKALVAADDGGGARDQPPTG